MKLSLNMTKIFKNRVWSNHIKTQNLQHQESKREIHAEIGRIMSEIFEDDGYFWNVGQGSLVRQRWGNTFKRVSWSNSEAAGSHPGHTVISRRKLSLLQQQSAKLPSNCCSLQLSPKIQTFCGLTKVALHDKTLDPPINKETKMSEPNANLLFFASLRFCTHELIEIYERI